MLRDIDDRQKGYYLIFLSFYFLMVINDCKDIDIDEKKL